MTQEWNGNLKDALRGEISSQDAMLMTTPHLSAIRHTAAALLALLEEREGDRRPAPSERAEAATGLPFKERPAVTFVLTDFGRRRAGMMRLGVREDVSGGHGLTVKENNDVVLHTDDPEAVRRVRTFFEGEVVCVVGERAGAIHALIGAIRRAISEYDKTGDHCSHDANSDCVRCNAAAAVYQHDDPRRQLPRRKSA